MPGLFHLALSAAALAALLPAASAGATPSKRMADGKRWTTRNLSAAAPESYCYEGSEANCRKYGRLYTWESAGRACRALGEGWRLPGNADWQELSRRYGGLLEESAEGGKAAYEALREGGRSGFRARLGGGRNLEGQFTRLDAHGFFWTASETGAGTAWFYNLGRGMSAVNRHPDGEKARALSVRCVKD